MFELMLSCHQGYMHGFLIIIIMCSNLIYPPSPPHPHTTTPPTVFAFVIKMPTMHRLSCFRDDIIFFIMLYQRLVGVCAMCV